MRLSAELLGSCEQRQNALEEREILLRGLAIPAIEHLGVTRDAYDAMDFSDNRVGRLDNFPRLLRLVSLNISGNVVESIDAVNLNKNLPNLKHLDLSYNQISSLYQVSQMGKGCPKLEFLSLNGNAVTSKLHYIVRMVYYGMLSSLVVSDTDVSLPSYYMIAA
jgi:U2 small nuclear ribonucleoprotein A'